MWPYNIVNSKPLNFEKYFIYSSNIKFNVNTGIENNLFKDSLKYKYDFTYFQITALII